MLRHLPMESKVVVITGATGGIGSALARQVYARGASVALVARREALLNELVAALGSGALGCRADVTARDQVVEAVRATVANFGRIDVRVNKDGIA